MQDILAAVSKLPETTGRKARGLKRVHTAPGRWPEIPLPQGGRLWGYGRTEDYKEYGKSRAK